MATTASPTDLLSRVRHDLIGQGPFGGGYSGAALRAAVSNAPASRGSHGGPHDTTRLPRDLAEDPTSIALIEGTFAAGTPLGFVCHAPAVLRHATVSGRPLVEGRRVTGFTNSEEEAVQLTTVVPFLVEDELKRLGGRYEQAPDWQRFAITDGHLVTGQNPASSVTSAEGRARARQSAPRRGTVTRSAAAPSDNTHGGSS